MEDNISSEGSGLGDGIRGYWLKDGKFHEGMPPAGEPNPEWMTPDTDNYIPGKCVSCDNMAMFFEGNLPTSCSSPGCGGTLIPAKNFVKPNPA